MRLFFLTLLQGVFLASCALRTPPPAPDLAAPAAEEPLSLSVPPAPTPAPSATPSPLAPPPTEPNPTTTVPTEEASREPLPLDETREFAARRSQLVDYARQFDRYLRGQLSPEQVQALKASCRRNRANPFCPTLRRARRLERFLAERSRIYQPPPLSPPIPVRVESQNGQIQNWRELRRAKVPALLKGLITLPLPELREIAKKAQAERRCPNQIAIATAATLEDYLPDSSLHPILSALYEKGARCAAKDPVDREHFRTRAALFLYKDGRYEEAAALLKKVRATDAFSGRSAYWLYRSYLAQGNQAQAHKARDRLVRLHPFSFHALMASLTFQEDPAQRYLGSRDVLRPRSKRFSQTNALIQQVEWLHQLGFSESAAILAHWGLSGPYRAEGEVQLYLASLGDDRTRIATLPGLLLRRPKLLARESLELLYPTRFLALCEQRGHGVDPYLVLAVARKESGFNPTAVSIAGAVGLMQLNPDTAKELTKGVAVDLMSPETNIELGARYLAALQSRLGDTALALAAYNAGEPPVASWQKRFSSKDKILFLDLIPYRETRDYVGYVLSNYYWYSRLYRGRPPEPLQGLSPLLAE